MKNACILCCCLILLFFCNCNKNGGNPKPAPVAQAILPALLDTPGTPFVYDSFPLVVGHVWKYMVQVQDYQSIYYDYGYNKNVYYNIDTSYFTIKAVSDTIIAGMYIVKLQIDSTLSMGLFLTPFEFSVRNAYYSNCPDGLQEFYSLNGPSYVNYYDSSTTQYAYVARPMNAEYENRYVSAGNNWLTCYQTWLSYDKVSTSAGGFNCIKLQSHYEEQNIDDVEYQYYSSKGLIKSYIVNTGHDYSTGQYNITDIETYIVTLVSVNF